MGAYLALDPFPEVPAMLAVPAARRHAHARSCPTAIPTCSTRWWRRRVSPTHFEAVLSVDEVGVFKPDPRVYRLVEARCGVTPDKVCFLSSNCWDAHGAAQFGFRTVWVNRAGAPDDNLPGTTRGPDPRPVRPSRPAWCSTMSLASRPSPTSRPPPAASKASRSARRCSRTSGSIASWAAGCSSRPSACSAPARSSCAAPTISSPR